jgi:hypothetical protein
MVEMVTKKLKLRNLVNITVFHKPNILSPSSVQKIAWFSNIRFNITPSDMSTSHKKFLPIKFSYRNV